MVQIYVHNVAQAKIRQSGNKDDFIVVQAAGNGYRKNKIANVKGRDASNTGFLPVFLKKIVIIKMIFL